MVIAIVIRPKDEQLAITLDRKKNGHGWMQVIGTGVWEGD